MLAKFLWVLVYVPGFLLLLLAYGGEGILEWTIVISHPGGGLTPIMLQKQEITTDNLLQNRTDLT